MRFDLDIQQMTFYVYGEKYILLEMLMFVGAELGGRNLDVVSIDTL